MARITITIAEELSQQIEQQPDELDLDPTLSQSRRFAMLVEEAVARRRALRLERERHAAYAEQAADPAHAASVGELFELALAGGLLQTT
ncbi:MAG: hypothetical protein ACR2J9_12035 [Gaiellales bacterium]